MPHSNENLNLIPNNLNHPYLFPRLDFTQVDMNISKVMKEFDKKFGKEIKSFIKEKLIEARREQLDLIIRQYLKDDGMFMHFLDLLKKDLDKEVK